MVKHQIIVPKGAKDHVLVVSEKLLPKKGKVKLAEASNPIQNYLSARTGIYKTARY